MKRLFLMAVMSAAILFTVSGCQKGKNADLTDSTVISDLPEMSNEDSVTNDEDVKVLKAAALSRNAAKMWLLAGGELAAVPEEACDLEVVSEDIVSLGKESEPETGGLKDLDIDVVIADRTIAGYANIRKDLSHLQCDILEVGAESFEDYAASIKLLTEYTKDEKSYTRHAEKVRSRCEDIIAKAYEASGNVKVTVTQSPGNSMKDESVSDAVPGTSYHGRAPSYLVIRVSDDYCRVVTNDDFICGMLKDFGMTNANMSGRQVAVRKADVNTESGSETESESEPESVDETESASESIAEIESESGSEAESGCESASESVTETVDESAESPDEASRTDSGTVEESRSFDAFAENGEDRGDWETGRRLLENILTNNPDFIFIVYEGKEKAAAALCGELVKSCGNWKDTYAWKSGRVYELPQSTFRYPPYDRWDMAYEYLYQVIYKM